MKLEAVASLGIRLSQLSDRAEAGRTAAQGVLTAFEADAAFVWLPPQPGPCREEDLFAAGDLLVTAPAAEIAAVVHAGAIERWLDVRGAAVVSILPIGAAGTAFGLLAVGWRQAPGMSGRIDAFLALVAEQLRALLSRQRPAPRVGPQPTADIDHHQVVEDLKRELAQAHDELARRQHASESSLPDDRYRTIFESTSDYVFVKDIWGRYVDANGAYLFALGREAEEVIGKRDTDLFSADFALETTARDHITQISGQTLEDESTWMLRGRPRHLLVRRSPWRDGGGQTIGVVSVATDITERKLADVRRDQALAEVSATNQRIQQLLEEQMRLSQRGSGLLELARSLTIETDIEAVHRLVLETAERQLNGAVMLVCHLEPGTAAMMVKGGTLRGETARDDACGEAMAASFASDVIAGHGAVSLPLDPERPFDARLIAAGLRGVTALRVPVEGQPAPVLVVGWEEPRVPAREDLWFLENLAVQLGLALRNAHLYGDLRQSVLAVRAAEQQMRRTERLRAFGELASRIAHDFNNSLTSILGLADWLLYTLPPRAKGRDEIQTIRNAATDTANLVTRLRELARVAPVSEAREVVDPLETVRGLPELLRSRFDDERRAGIARDLVLELRPAPFVHVVPSEFREVLLQFVGNAADAMPRGGRITVRTEERDGRACVSVEDEGEGMSEQVRTHLFEPFFTTKRGEHVGLGLSVCRNIAERHGAVIEVRENAGAGSCFEFLLPAAGSEGEVESMPGPAAATEAGDVDTAARSIPGEPLTLLLVDDQIDVLDTLAEMVSALGHRVETAGDGAGALALLQQRHVDLVITDLGMPGMSGRELAREAVRAHPGLKVIVMTGWTAEAEEPRGPGVAQVVGKPLSMSRLKAIIGSVVHAAA